MWGELAIWFLLVAILIWLFYNADIKDDSMMGQIIMFLKSKYPKLFKY